MARLICHDRTDSPVNPNVTKESPMIKSAARRRAAVLLAVAALLTGGAAAAASPAYAGPSACCTKG